MITNSVLAQNSVRGTQPLAKPVPRPKCHEYYLTLLRSLPLACNAARNPISAVGITSCYAGEGVSTVAVQLALAAVSTGMRVVLVDLNWRRPAVHRLFNVPAGPGVSEALSGLVDSDSCIQPSPIAGLSLMTAGAVAGHVNAAASLDQLGGLIRSLRADYELLIFDLPESAPAGSDLPVGRMLDGIVMVIEAHRVRWEVAARVQELLSRAGVNVLGAVLNKRRQPIPGWLYRTL